MLSKTGWQSITCPLFIRSMITYRKRFPTTTVDDARTPFVIHFCSSPFYEKHKIMLAVFVIIPNILKVGAHKKKIYSIIILGKIKYASITCPLYLLRLSMITHLTNDF